MIWNAKNGRVSLDGTDMDFVSFGRGKRALILLPGLSDGLTTVRGKALLLARPYRLFFGDRAVYMFSRRNALAEGTTIREMAADQARVLQALGIGRAAVVGVSEGGMIAQYLAMDHPELVEKLVLAVTAPRCTPLARACLERWIGFAERGDHRGLMTDTAERSYSEARLRRLRPAYPLLGRVGRPKSYDRFLVNARAILGFDARAELERIACPTLILGGERDQIVGPEASRELHAGIAGSRIHMYEGLGHAAYEEAGDFYPRIQAFLQEQT